MTLPVRVHDGGAFSNVFELSVIVNAGNDTPTEITLSNASVPESEPADTLVGSLSTSDPDVGDIFTYTLVSGEGDMDNASFHLSGNSLLTSAVFDYE